MIYSDPATHFASDEFLSEIPGEECGVVAVHNHPEAAKLCYLGLYAMQHRGQESAGIVSSDGQRLHLHKAAGLVADVFTDKVLNSLPGSSAIGHVRYSTTGSSVLANAQPILANYSGGPVAVGHNGNLTNADVLRRELESRGAIFQGTTDTECLIHLIAQAGPVPFEEALINGLARMRGAWSIVVIRPDQLVAARDPLGFRPLVLGKVGDGYVVASESCALDIMNAQYLRVVDPGEVLHFRNGSVRSVAPFPEAEPAFCAFEYVYFSRPDSIAQHGRTISELRQRLGEQLAVEHPAPDAQVVVAVPDSSVPAAIGYARRAAVPYDIGLVRSHYVGRTFIEPDQRIRDFGARIKYNPVRSVLYDKSVVVVDDSIVRGTTSRKIVTMLREAGARRIHFRVSSPVWKNPCYFGIDTPERDKLIGANSTVEEMRQYLGADSLGFLSEEGLLRSLPRSQGYCLACFNGKYPNGQAPQEGYSKEVLEAQVR
jgi:amidophosphoribosyltransferase